MRARVRITGRTATLLWVLAALVLTPLPAFSDDEDPVVDSSRTTQKLESLKRDDSRPRPVATVYEFRSSVPEISSRACTDMFTTALIKSGAFVVAERQRVYEGVIREKQINAQGFTTGDTANEKLAGADVIFEGTISEANAGEREREGGLSVGGMDVGGGASRNTLGIDVRVVNARTGVVVDAINVRKNVDAGGSAVSGVGRLAQSIAGLRGKSIPLDPDVRYKTSRKEGLDKALRSCIEAAVYEIIKRM